MEGKVISLTIILILVAASTGCYSSKEENDRIDTSPGLPSSDTDSPSEAKLADIRKEIRALARDIEKNRIAIEEIGAFRNSGNNLIQSPLGSIGVDIERAKKSIQSVIVENQSIIDDILAQDPGSRFVAKPKQIVASCRNALDDLKSIKSEDGLKMWRKKWTELLD